MRSIYIKILLWCFGSLGVCIAAFGFVSSYVFYQMVGEDSFFECSNALQLAEAREVLRNSGARPACCTLRKSEHAAGRLSLPHRRTGERSCHRRRSLGSSWPIPGPLGRVPNQG